MPFNHGSISIQEKGILNNYVMDTRTIVWFSRPQVSCRYIGENIESNQDEDLHGVKLNADFLEC